MPDRKRDSRAGCSLFQLARFVHGAFCSLRLRPCQWSDRKCACQNKYSQFAPAGFSAPRDPCDTSRGNSRRRNSFPCPRRELCFSRRGRCAQSARSAKAKSSAPSNRPSRQKSQTNAAQFPPCFSFRNPAAEITLNSRPQTAEFLQNCGGYVVVLPNDLLDTRQLWSGYMLGVDSLPHVTRMLIHGEISDCNGSWFLALPGPDNPEVIEVRQVILLVHFRCPGHIFSRFPFGLCVWHHVNQDFRLLPSDQS